MSFEKEYYEHEGFWDGNLLTDENNTKRYLKTIELIPKEVNSLVDIGCGNGIFLNKLKELNSIDNLLGVDRSEKALSYLKTNKFLSDINETKLENNSFDCVSSLEVIEHLPIPEYKKALEELTRISKKYIIISVPYNEKLEDSYNKCPSCLTIFNQELHLRSYNSEKFKTLLDKYGFKNIYSSLEGKSSKFYGHDLFISIFHPSQKMKFNSPICPICGFKEEKRETSPSKKSINQSSIFSIIKSIPKKFWPKKTSHYWIIGLFEKID